MRIWFGFMSAVLWVGIALTGFLQVHWLLYVPAAGLLFSAGTGICPSQMALAKLFGVK